MREGLTWWPLENIKVQKAEPQHNCDLQRGGGPHLYVTFFKGV